VSHLELYHWLEHCCKGATLCNSRVIWCSSNDEVYGERWLEMYCN